VGDVRIFDNGLAGKIKHFRSGEHSPGTFANLAQLAYAFESKIEIAKPSEQPPT